MLARAAAQVVVRAEPRTRHRACSAARRMRYDLEDEVLRAAAALRQRDGDFPFLLESLRELVASEPARFPRLTHPLVTPFVAALVERLVADGLLERDGGTLCMTEATRAQLAREPEYLGAPPERAGQDTHAATSASAARTA